MDPHDEAYDRRLANHLVSLYFKSQQENTSEQLDMALLRDYIGEFLFFQLFLPCDKKSIWLYLTSLSIFLKLIYCFFYYLRYGFSISYSTNLCIWLEFLKLLIWFDFQPTQKPTSAPDWATRPRNSLSKSICSWERWKFIFYFSIFYPASRNLAESMFKMTFTHHYLSCGIYFAKISLDYIISEKETFFQNLP